MWLQMTGELWHIFGCGVKGFLLNVPPLCFVHFIFLNLGIRFSFLFSCIK